MDLFKTIRQEIVNQAKEKITNTKGNIYKTGLKIELKNFGISNNNIVIDEASLLEILEKEKNVFKEFHNYLSIIIDFKGINLTDTDLIIKSSKKLNLSTEIKKKKLNLTLKFDNYNYNHKIKNFVLDIKKENHNEQINFEFENTLLIENIEFKSKFFDCFKIFGKTFFNFDFVFDWKKQYAKNFEDFKSNFLSFISSLKKDFTGSKIIFKIDYSCEDFKTFCETKLFEFYFYLKNQLKDIPHKISIKANCKDSQKLIGYTDCSKETVEFEDLSNIDFKPFETDEFEDFKVLSFNEIVVKNSNDIDLNLKRGINCKRLIFENISGEFFFRLFENGVLPDNYVWDTPKEVVIRNSNLSKLYLDTNFFKALFKIFIKREKTYFEKITFENLKINKLIISDGLIPFLNDNSKKIKSKFLFSDYDGSVVDIEFKNVSANKVVIVSDFSLYGIVILPTYGENEKQKTFRLFQNSIINLKLKNRDEYFFKYLLSNINADFLVSFLYNLAKDVVKFKNITFGILKGEKNIVELNKKQVKILNRILKDESFAKGIIGFKNMKQFFS